MRIRTMLLAGIGIFVATPAAAQVQVQEHMRSSGKIVRAYERSVPNQETFDNNSIYPDFNPNTGRTGTRRGRGPLTFRPRTVRREVPVYSPPRRSQSSSAVSTGNGYRPLRQQPSTS